MYPSLNIRTKVGNEVYETSSSKVDYFDVKRFDNGEITLHELVNTVFPPEDQVNNAQANLLGPILIAAMGGPAQAQVGTGGGGSESKLPWNDKDKKKGARGR